MPSEKQDRVVVHLWEVSSQRSAPERESDARSLTASEQRRAERYRFDRDRNLFVSCRAALRRVLGRQLDVAPGEVPVTPDAQGKPQVVGAPFDFNVSHAGGRGLIVLSDQRVGVDLEPIRPIPDAAAIARRFFSEAEQTAIFRDSDADQVSRRFFRCWTLKEAFLKARGVGLSGSLSDFTVDIDRETSRLAWRDQVTGGEERAWSLGFLPAAEGYVAAVAVDGPSWTLRREGRA